MAHKFVILEEQPDDQVDDEYNPNTDDYYSEVWLPCTDDLILSERHREKAAFGLPTFQFTQNRSELHKESDRKPVDGVCV